jgi:Tfp pilus assembly protein PilO
MGRGLLVGFLLALLIGAGFYYLGVKPIQEQITEIDQQILAAQGENATLLQERNRLTRIEDAEFEYRAAVGQLETYVPTSPLQSELIIGLKSLAVDSSVEWTGVSFSLPTAVPDVNYSEIHFAVQIEGSYFELLGYLHSMEEMERVVRIEGATFSPSVAENGIVSLTASISATAFTTGDVGLINVDIPEEEAPEETEADATTGDE